MSHPFGDLIAHHLHRKHGLSQAKLAAGIDQDPAVISNMCRGRRLTGTQAHERVLAIIGWLHGQGALATVREANALLHAAGYADLRRDVAPERALLDTLAPGPDFPVAPDRAAKAQLSPQPTNLPGSLTSFVGRGAAQDDLQARLAPGRLVTLVGPGGVGKTRLAVAYALTA